MRISDWSSDVCSSDLSSLYRVIGLPGASERVVPGQGTTLQALIRKTRGKASAEVVGALDADPFDTLLNSVLESPKRSNQSAKRFLQVMPPRSKEHTSELPSLMRHSDAVFCMNN